MSRPAAPLVERLEAAGRDERLSTGALYLEAATALRLAQAEIKGHMRVVDELKVTAEAERDCRMEAEGVAAKLQRRLRDEEDKYQGALIRADNIKVELTQAQARIAELEKRIEVLQKFNLQVMAYCQPIISKSLWARVEMFADQYNAAIEALKSRA